MNYPQITQIPQIRHKEKYVRNLFLPYLRNLWTTFWFARGRDAVSRLQHFW